MEDPDSGPRMTHQTKEGAVVAGIEVEEGSQAAGSCCGSGRRTFVVSLEACAGEVCDAVSELVTVLAVEGGG